MNSPEFLENIKTTGLEKWQGLQPRERIMLIVAPIILVIGIIATIFNSVHNDMEKQMSETENYRKALNTIIDNEATYHQNQARKEALNKRLLAADAKIVSRLNSEASSLGLSADVTPKATRTLEDSGAEESEIEIRLQNVDYSKCIEFLVKIHQLKSESEEDLDLPIYMRSINLSRSSVNATETKMNLTILLMSYRMKEQNGT